MLRKSPSWSSAEVAKLIGVLQQGTSYAEAILERSPVGIALISRDQQVVYANTFANISIPELNSKVQALAEYCRRVFQTGAAIEKIESGFESYQICLHPFDSEHLLFLVTTPGGNTESPFQALSLVASPIAVVNQSAGILFANEAFGRISGYGPDEIIGKEVLALGEPVCSNGASRSSIGSATLLHRCGKRTSVEISRQPIAYQRATACVVTITAENIDPVRPEEPVMAALERVCGQVAHRFNNLLTVVLAYTDLISTQYKSVDPLKSDLDRITEAARQMSDLTQDLLVFSHGRPVSPVPVDVDKVVSGMENMLQAVAGSSPIEIHAGSNGGRVNLAVKELETVLLNLVRNAREAVRPNAAAITVSTFKLSPGTPEYEVVIPHLDLTPRPYLCVTVEDTGVGLAPAHRMNMFEPFYTTKPGASGLGLSVTYGIVKRAGGGMLIDTNASAGTTVRVVLPETSV